MKTAEECKKFTLPFSTARVFRCNRRKVLKSKDKEKCKAQKEP
jgi:hypothetical protein